MTAPTLESLARDLAELRAENGRMKTLLALHGVDVDEVEGWIDLVEQRLDEVCRLSSDTRAFRERLNAIEWAFKAVRET